MAYPVTTDRSTAPRQPPPPAFAGTAYAVFAAAFAVGTLIHEFQSTIVWWMAIPVAAAAFWLLLRPARPARLMLVLALLAVESVVSLPSPSNHQVAMGILGFALVPWWLLLRLRDPAAAGNPAEVLRRAGPFLRVSFVLLWVFAALSKANSGFLDVLSSCSVWVLESIPLVEVPHGLHRWVIVATIAFEAAIPLLLLMHRTRPYAVVLAFGFHLVSAFAGHSSFSGFAWSMYALFLPPAVLARGAALGAGGARRFVPAGLRALAVGRQAAVLVALVGAWVAVRYGLLALLPDGVQGGARHWGAVLLCVTFMGATGGVLLRLRRHWLPAQGPRADLRVRSGLMLFGIGLLVLTAAMPYLGLKTRAAFTMFSNVRTEPGHWNHLLVPEEVRVFGWQDGRVTFLGTDDPRLAERITATDSDDVAVVGARAVVDGFPGATVRYRLDGVDRVAAPV
ncbi:hypothetical protein, partial [Pseudonocardia sp.]|uniref:hypothetical protein n=1 Tax=Pseudonocardia sp. TaxID=60912 RepID=UPI003D0ADFB6